VKTYKSLKTFLFRQTFRPSSVTTVTVRPALLKSFDILALYKFVYYYYYYYKVTRGENFRYKDQGHRKRKCKNRFSRTSSSKVDRFTSNQDQND